MEIFRCVVCKKYGEIVYCNLWIPLKDSEVPEVTEIKLTVCPYCK